MRLLGQSGVEAPQFDVIIAGAGAVGANAA